jgi:hypothetical protein
MVGAVLKVKVFSEEQAGVGPVVNDFNAVLPPLPSWGLCRGCHLGQLLFGRLLKDRDRLLLSGHERLTALGALDALAAGLLRAIDAGGTGTGRALDAEGGHGTDSWPGARPPPAGSLYAAARQAQLAGSNPAARCEDYHHSPGAMQAGSIARALDAAN